MARYIDADKFAERIKLSPAFKNIGFIEGDLLQSVVLDLLDNAPTADVEEVKHGEWIDKWDGKYANPTYVCSNCGEKALLENYINELDQWRYRQSLSIRCPHCGAKMDGQAPQKINHDSLCETETYKVGDVK